MKRMSRPRRGAIGMAARAVALLLAVLVLLSAGLAEGLAPEIAEIAAEAMTAESEAGIVSEAVDAAVPEADEFELEPDAQAEAPSPEEEAEAVAEDDAAALGAAAIPSTLTIGVKESLPLLGEGGSTEGWTFASADAKIAKISASGAVTGVKVGKTKVAAKDAAGKITYCSVTVKKAPKSVSVSAKALALAVNEAAQLTTALPKNTASRITWVSSDEAVVRVDEAGRVTAVGAGSAAVAAVTFNKKRAVCQVTVLAGSAPSAVTLSQTALTLGVKETFTLVPAIGPGEATVFAYASKNKKIASVNQKGVVTAKKTGSTQIAVRTHNGLTAICTVKVVAAPKKVAVRPETVRLAVGETAALEVAVSPGGNLSGLTFKSDDTAVATVSDAGVITAVAEGSTTVTVRTYNKKSASAKVIVGDSGAPSEDTAALGKMAANLNRNSSLGMGAKKAAVVSVVDMLLKEGFEPAYAAGVAANIMAEGDYGFFESSKYVTYPNKRPRYFAYLDGGEFHQGYGSKATDIYLTKSEYKSYKGKLKKHYCYAERNYYLNNWSKKNAWEINLAELEKLMADLEKGNWEGKFGLGIVQWTGEETGKLVKFYRAEAGSANTLTRAQVAAAENKLILSDMKSTYAYVHTQWKKENSGRLDTETAAANAASILCLKYEIPVSKETKAKQRAAVARKIYNVMVGKK